MRPRRSKRLLDARPLMADILARIKPKPEVQTDIDAPANKEPKGGENHGAKKD